MRLFVSETEVQDAVIPIRWCLGRSEFKELEEREAKDAQLLLVVMHEGSEVDRYLVPLSQMLAYIQFHKPGKNRILATVVWNWEGKTNELKKHFLEQYCDGDYRRTVLDDYNKENFRSYLGYSRLEQQTEITVMVPAELFVKEPPAWEKWWVNLWFEIKKPRDQCHYRRRRMLAYTVQPPVILLFVIFATIFRVLAAGVLLFLGKRGVNLKPVIHPFKYRSDYVWSDTKASIFWRDTEGKRQPWFITLLSPPFYAGVFAVLVGIKLIFPSLVSELALKWWYYPLVALAFTVGTVLIVSISIGLSFIAYPLARLALKALKGSALAERKEKKRMARKQARAGARNRRTEKEEEERRRRQEQLRVELEQILACNGDFTPELNALPKDKQTIYLRFQDLKAKVCKPFAR